MSSSSSSSSPMSVTPLTWRARGSSSVRAGSRASAAGAKCAFYSDPTIAAGLHELRSAAFAVYKSLRDPRTCAVIQRYDKGKMEALRRALEVACAPGAPVSVSGGINFKMNVSLPALGVVRYLMGINESHPRYLDALVDVADDAYWLCVVPAENTCRREADNAELGASDGRRSFDGPALSMTDCDTATDSWGIAALQSRSATIEAPTFPLGDTEEIGRTYSGALAAAKFEDQFAPVWLRAAAYDEDI